MRQLSRAAALVALCFVLQVQNQCLNEDFNVAYDGTPVFTVSRSNSTCTCPNILAISKLSGDVTATRVLTVSGTATAASLTVATTATASNVVASSNVQIGGATATPKLAIANGANDPLNYGKGIQITNPATGGQAMAFIRSGNNIASLGYSQSSSIFGLGVGQLTDNLFTPGFLSVDMLSGSVGVATPTPSPSFKLDVNGAARVVGDLTVNGRLNLLPAGIVAPWAGTGAAPTGWLLCSGQAVSRTVYAALFAAVGTTYGAGDGSTTFNVPDMRGRTPVGLDNMGGSASGRVSAATAVGAAAGAATHTLVAAEMPSHAHSFTTGTGNAKFYRHVYAAGGGRAPNHQTGYDGVNGYADYTDTAYTGADHTHSGTTNGAGSGAAHNNMPPYMTVQYIISY